MLLSHTLQFASHQGVRFCGVHDTSETDSAVSNCTLRSQNKNVAGLWLLLKGQSDKILELMSWMNRFGGKGGGRFSLSLKFWLRGVMRTLGVRIVKVMIEYLGVQHTAESDSAVCCTPGSQAPRCASHHGVKLRNVHHTAESDSVVCFTTRSQ